MTRRRASLAAAVTIAAATALTTVPAGSAAAAGAQVATAKPAISSLTVSKKALPDSGGSVTLRATVKHGGTCAVAVTPKLSGFPKAIACRPKTHHSARKIAAKATLPPNTTAKAKSYRFSLSTHSHRHIATKSVTVAVAATPPPPPAPSIVTFTADPTTSPSSGGTVYVRIAVKNAKTCSLSSIPAISGLPEVIDCTPDMSDGSWTHTEQITVPANSGSTATSYSLSLNVASPQGTAHAVAPSISVAKPATGALTWNLTSITTDASEAAALSVSCPTSTFCAVSDIDGDVLTYKNGTWSPAAVNLAPSNTIIDVRCTSSTFCLALNTGGTKPGYVSTYNGTSWTTPALVDQSATDAACVPTSNGRFCMIVDSAGKFITGDGTTWTTPASDDTSGNKQFLSCFSATFCVVADDAGDTTVYNGSSWTTPALIDSDHGFITVSCGTSSSCTAVDKNGVGWKYTSGTWATAGLTDHAGEQATYQDYSIACTSATFCINVDASGHADSYNGTSWSDSGVISSVPIYAISCATKSFCMAVDYSGEAIIGTA